MRVQVGGVPKKPAAQTQVDNDVDPVTSVVVFGEQSVQLAAPALENEPLGQREALVKLKGQ